MNKLRHILVCVLALFVILGIPTLKYMDFSAAFSNDPDAVTQATGEIPDAPSGDFVVLVNKERHTDPEALSQWETFFSGGDAGVILEDIDCRVIGYDSAGMQLAQRFQMRLPENQMSLEPEDGMMLISKAEAGEFDVVILSREVGEAYGFETIKENDDVVWLDVREDE